MQLANALLKIDNEGWTSVPKDGITPSEIAVLRHMFGADAVYNIEPAGEVERSNRAERSRLKQIYAPREGVAMGGSSGDPVEILFPGQAARVYETLDELELPDDLYKAERRVRADSQPSEAASAAGKVGAKRRAAPAQSVDDDGIGDMPQTGAMFS